MKTNNTKIYIACIILLILQAFFIIFLSFINFFLFSIFVSVLLCYLFKKHYDIYKQIVIYSIVSTFLLLMAILYFSLYNISEGTLISYGKYLIIIGLIYFITTILYILIYKKLVLIFQNDEKIVKTINHIKKFNFYSIITMPTFFITILCIVISKIYEIKLFFILLEKKEIDSLIFIEN